jgi:hypothetical protein
MSPKSKSPAEAGLGSPLLIGFADRLLDEAVLE